MIGRDRFDLVVVGGGTGGLVSAQIAAAAGARVALVEQSRLGGDCLWTGCAPSKSLLAAAELAHRMRTADAVGLTPTEPHIDFAAVIAHIERAQRTIEPQDSAERLRAAGVELVLAPAQFEDATTISAGGRALRFRRAIIATGSRPAPVPGFERALTTATIWDLRALPTRLLVLGAGPVGCELAQGFARLGSRVTLREREARLLPGEEPAASALIARRLAAEGVRVQLGEGASDAADGEVLLAAGRSPNSGGLRLERAGVHTDERGAVRVDERLRTSAPRIYAVGDVTGAMAFTHVAAYHARVATVNALFAGRRRVDYRAVPRVTFTDPQIARVGVTEAQARARWGERTRVAAFDLADLDRAIVAGERDGLARLIGDPRGRLVGATIAAPHAGEAIAELAAWITVGRRIDDVSHAVHAYPTFAEAPARAADQYLYAGLTSARMRVLTRAALWVLRARGIG
ncbi:MAG TPA: FAD-dependent oxidoreductase [Solirubrobacteraceae bacterium]|jgi:pyruvate/2-oxoglutarate dehydrogenase complex dihydrolipoamide dehydrogenase (E3) component|nr:FAD-dependent oxidoreductase [Solirubrobacteraceae bacterium]